MSKSIIAEGKTTTEAINNGLKELKVSREMVEVNVLENKEKRSFFSILSPRVVKVELTVKENIVPEKPSRANTKNNTERKPKKTVRRERDVIPTSEEDIEMAKNNTDKFLKDFTSKFEELTYTVIYDGEFLAVNIDGKDTSKLIGYRGEVLNSLQTIIKTVANKNCKTRVKVTLNIGDYKQKREKSLQELADKIARTVQKTGRMITLEPMVAYERKIIHSRLQPNSRVKTYSVGEEPYRKVVVAKK